MLSDIDWDSVLLRSDEFAKELLDDDGVALFSVPLPSDIIYRLCRRGLGKADPKYCYE
ncbi:MAG: hypothetical protein HC836_25755 [Richelia sp. RM2_1_2]|nr:hypothetical protein [Richelia sp. RM2_1_2]